MGDVFARRFGADGTPLATEFQVNVYTPAKQEFQPSRSAATAISSSPGRAGSPTTPTRDIVARRFDAMGTAIGGDFQVNLYTTTYRGGPSLSMDGYGDFVVVWHSHSQDGYGFGVFGRRFNESGAGFGVEFQVNTSTVEHERIPEVRADGDGDVLICWEVGPTNYDVFCRRFDSSGTAQDMEFRVNSYTTNAQYNVAVGMAPDGDFVVAWDSSGQDGAGVGVFAQRFAVSPKIFDLDANGVVQPLTDGLLFLRYSSASATPRCSPAPSPRTARGARRS